MRRAGQGAAGALTLVSGGGIFTRLRVDSDDPTTGFMLIVPPEQLRPTDLSVEEALKMIVSAGVGGAPSLALPAEASPCG